MKALTKARTVAAVATAAPRRIRWDTDGPNDTVSSMSILIGWLSDENNYARWKGEDSNGATKTVLCTEISCAIAAAGVLIERTGKDVHMKINAVEQGFRSASDWLEHTGQGITCEKNIKEAVLNYCPYFYELQDVMLSRASTRPLLTNYDSGNDNNDDNEEIGTEEENFGFTLSDEASIERRTAEAMLPYETDDDSFNEDLRRCAANASVRNNMVVTFNAVAGDPTPTDAPDDDPNNNERASA
jgi:hypothetical protein